MAGDLKTLKCMYNISKGGNSKSPCLYCKQLAYVLDFKWWRKAPNRDKEDPNFNAVLDIPLCNVHFAHCMHCVELLRNLFFYILDLPGNFGLR